MSAPVIELDVGKVRGKSEKVAGIEVESYFKVPFAEPPVGELRLEKPVPIKAWSGTLDCLEHPKAAIPLIAPNLNGLSEDCLYLNIFRPKNRPDAKCPIFFMVHGGGFEFGNCMRYANIEENAKKFLSKGIIMVAIQYRLAVLGFASDPSDPSLNGNLGLFDQATALDFIHRNAEALGGDPSRITAYGCSAGGVSVSYLLLSPLTRDKLAAGISLSGSGLAVWANCEKVKEKTVALAKALGQKEGESCKEVIKKATVEEIFAALKKIGITYDNQNFTTFGPRIDGEYFPKDIPELISEAPKKPYVMGCTTQESLLWTLLSASNDVYHTMGIPDSKRATFGKPDLIKLAEKLAKPVDPSKTPIELMIEEYSNREGDKNNVFYMNQYTSIYSDLQFNIPILLELWLKTLAGWTVFAYKNEYANVKFFPEDCPIHVSYHGLDQRYFLQGYGYSQPEFFSPDDRKVENLLVDSIVNFINTGNPSSETLTWPHTTPEEPFKHAKIHPQPEIQTDFFRDSLKFYANLMTKYDYDLPRLLKTPVEQLEKKYQLKRLLKILSNVKKIGGKLIFDDYDTGRFLAERAEQLALPHTFVAPTNALEINLQIQQIFLLDQVDSDLFLAYPPRQPNPTPVTDVVLINIVSECRPDVVSHLALPYFGTGSSTELHIITMAVHRPTRELYRSLLLKKPKRKPILYQGMTLQGIMEDNTTSFGSVSKIEYSPAHN
ncbi:unnamed protein product [Bursaphelenchus xylophilus]|uniref:(pine wood nematode) hypothetical protein n=1 Tax=Bursaphelenchus xylophilus TaxID=6326 RepID=A0A1I7RX62_BURXY|nr:unnamed protein product [Bursaphelenchus xylophilus]CAG9121352.1 unnamed protein product [Bursaphelenchus xylophilus]